MSEQVGPPRALAGPRNTPADGGGEVTGPGHGRAHDTGTEKPKRFPIARSSSAAGTATDPASSSIPDSAAASGGPGIRKMTFPLWPDASDRSSAIGIGLRSSASMPRRSAMNVAESIVSSGFEPAASRGQRLLEDTYRPRADAVQGQELGGRPFGDLVERREPRAHERPGRGVADRLGEVANRPGDRAAPGEDLLREPFGRPGQPRPPEPMVELLAVGD